MCLLRLGETIDMVDFVLEVRNTEYTLFSPPVGGNTIEMKLAERGMQVARFAILDLIWESDTNFVWKNDTWARFISDQ